MQPAIKLPFIDFSDFFHSIATWVIDFYPKAILWIKGSAGLIIGISIPLSLLFLIVIIYCVEQLKRIRNKESEMFDLKTVPAYEILPDNQKGDPEMARRWKGVVEHISSDKQNDWRQAIIDADIILDHILSKLGYQGQTVGDKLKRVAKGDFATLDDAWEAHKIRNLIAHEGSNYSIGQHDAKQAVDSYKKVFEEFYYI